MHICCERVDLAAVLMSVTDGTLCHERALVERIVEPTPSPRPSPPSLRGGRGRKMRKMTGRRPVPPRSGSHLRVVAPWASPTKVCMVAG